MREQKEMASCRLSRKEVKVYMTNGELYKRMLMKVIYDMPNEKLFNCALALEDIDFMHPIATMMRMGFEHEVYPNMSSREMDDFMYSDIFDKKMTAWLSKEKDESKV